MYSVCNKVKIEIQLKNYSLYARKVLLSEIH